jgi:hypothetical protein
LACCSKNATGKTTTVVIDIADEEFTATGEQPSALKLWLWTPIQSVQWKIIFLLRARDHRAELSRGLRV